MILEQQTLFSDDQALSGTSAVASDNVLDLGGGNSGVSRFNPGNGNPVRLLIQLTADAGGTSPTLDAVLEMADDAAFTSGKTTVATATTLSGGKAGDRMDIEFLPSNITKRYLRLVYTQGGSSPTHTVKAGILYDVQDNDFGG